MSARPRVPGFFTHLGLLWALRLRIGLNRGGKGGAVVAVAAFLSSSAPSVVGVTAFFALMKHPAVVGSELWPEFILRLLCFVTTATWVTWPVLSAGVDDHSELSRYAAYPISSLRLMIASTLAGLFEPRSLVFYGPLVGATAGYVATHGSHYPLGVVLLFLAYVLFNAALSRVGLHLVLNALRLQRSAELIGGGFAVTLLLASFIPPVDTSWLFRIQEAGAEAVPDTLVADAARALGRFPTGWFAHGVTWASNGALEVVAADLAGLVEMTMVALAVAWGLLFDFHRQSGRGVPLSARELGSNPFATTKTVFSTLVAREALDLWHNPRARLLAAVPFVLGILLKLLSGRALFVFFLGKAADAWLLSGLCLYGAMVLGSTFSQNAFAYDGHGFAAFLAAPLELGLVLRAKNLVHALAGSGLAVVVAVFYLAYFRHGTLLDLALALGGVATLVPTLLTAGNFLSLFYPVKFHANLKRRDKLPLQASMLGLAAASVGSAPLGFVLRGFHKGAPTWSALGLVMLAAVAAWGVYRLTLPLALVLLSRRRELVLRAVTRD